MKVREALNLAAARLSSESDTPRLDAELLMAHGLGTGREQLLLHELDTEEPQAFEALVDRRAEGEPIAYIVGRRDFWTIDVEVGPGALIPRPDSETLIEAALEHFGERGPRTILDLGTGPGTLLLAALDQWRQATGVGIDRSEQAVRLAKGNAVRLQLADRASFRTGDWAQGVSGPFDLILCNPPYIEESACLPRDVADWEPHSALFAGPEGLDDYRRLAPAIGPLLGDEGIACVEIGSSQEEAVKALFMQNGLKVHAKKDLGGHVRCLIASA